jgi:hypothetical protein
MGDATFMEDDKTTVAVSFGGAGTCQDKAFAIAGNTEESSVRLGRGWKAVFVCASLGVAALITTRSLQVSTTDTERSFYCRQIAAGECDYRNWDDSMSYIAYDLESGTLTPDDVINWLSPTCDATCIEPFYSV